MAGLDASGNVNEAQDAARLLSEAINSRDKQEAAKYLDQLLDLKLPVRVTIKPEAYSQESISLKVGVADAMSDVAVPITVMVPVYLTVSELKEKISHDYGFHPSLQRWVIGKRLAHDSETLLHYGVRNNDSAFLFVMTPKATKPSHEQDGKDEEEKQIEGVTENIETLNLADENTHTGNIPPFLPPEPQNGWSCPTCTYVNKPSRPGCEMCSAAKPDDCKLPDLYQP